MGVSLDVLSILLVGEVNAHLCECGSQLIQSIQIWAGVGQVLQELENFVDFIGRLSNPSLSH